MPAEGAMARLEPRALDLYVVTTGTLVSGRAHGEIATAAVEGGATAVQLRAPELSDDRLLPLAAVIARTCGEAGVLFFVNDRIEVAIRCDAAGAHVGQDQNLETARGRLGPERILGVSVGGEKEARAAEAAGADYLGVTIWETATKPEAIALGLSGLRAVAGATGLPVVGIGGITIGNAREVLGAGAAGIAVVSAVATADDPTGAVRELRSQVDDWYEDRHR
jgi:thiamine-phosphate pyrophosphorylase